MPIASGGSAPYAPCTTVIKVIEKYRETGLSTPIDTKVLARIGIAEANAQRTILSLKALELLDAEGVPTEALTTLKKLPEEKYKPALADIIRAAYSEVFKFTGDPSKATPTQLDDAFRGFEPAGQRPRMVMFFVNFSNYAGIGVAGAPKKRMNTREVNQVPQPQKARQADHHDHTPPAILGLVRSLPPEGSKLTEDKKNRFMRAFEAILDLTYSVCDEVEDDDDPSAKAV